MLNSMFVEDTVAETEQSQEYPGLISEVDGCKCVLHGFEIDLDGNVILPILGANHNNTNHCCV